MDVSELFRGEHTEPLTDLVRYRCHRCGLAVWQDKHGRGTEAMLDHAEAHERADARQAVRP